MNYFFKAGNDLANDLVTNKNIFKQYVEDNLENEDPKNLIQFVSGLLSNTNKNPYYLYFYAQQIAELTTDNQGIWSAIITNLYNRMKKAQSPWHADVITNWLKEDQKNNLNIFETDVEKIIYICFIFNKGENAIYWLKQFQEFKWFKKYYNVVQDKTIELSIHLNHNKLVRLFEIFIDYQYYVKLMNSIKIPKNHKDFKFIFFTMLDNLATNIETIKNFTAEDIDNILILNDCTTKPNLNNIIFIMHYYKTSKSLDLILDAIDNSVLSVDTKVKCLENLIDMDYERIPLKMYELTGDTNYLPMHVKDIFIF